LRIAFACFDLKFMPFILTAFAFSVNFSILFPFLLFYGHDTAGGGSGQPGRKIRGVLPTACKDKKARDCRGKLRLAATRDSILPRPGISLAVYIDVC